MRWSLYAVFGYGILNFIYFVATTGSQHFQMTGDAPDPVIRGFSGHWMIFYGAAFAIFYSRLNAPQLYSGCKCPLGTRFHRSTATARNAVARLRLGLEAPDQQSLIFYRIQTESICETNRFGCPMLWTSFRSFTAAWLIV